MKIMFIHSKNMHLYHGYASSNSASPAYNGHLNACYKNVCLKRRGEALVHI
jgi:hypothetical protein